MRTLISNGTIVTADASYAADVLIDGETIAAIGRDLAAGGATADESIDATGKYVIPGGIDVHTHMELPFGGAFAKDTFETGTRAAAFGGTTSIVDFAVQAKGQSLREGLDAWRAKAEGNAVTDYGFHMIMSDVNDATLAEMDGLVAEGIPDFKLFTAYPGVLYSDDGAIFRAMQQTAKNGGLIMMHAENGMAIDVVAAQTVAAGTTDPIGHALAHKSIFEGEATNRVIRLAEAAGVPVYIVHLSAREALDAVRAARDRGSRVFAETCPQYLFLSLDDMGGGFEGAKFVCSPPLRSKDHWDELWTGLIKDDLQLVATDHCPFDFHGQKEL
ncbi:MAG: amidohydrolase family protein, partial [Chloroflexota bacterium]